MFGNIHKIDQDVQRVERKVDDLTEHLKTLPDKMMESMKKFYHDRDLENDVASASVVRQMIQEQNELMKQQTDMLNSKIARISSSVRSIADGDTGDETVPPPPPTGVRPRGERGKWLWSHGPRERLKRYRENRWRFLPKDFRLSFDLKSKKRRRNPVDCSDEVITRKKVTAFDAWSWWWDGLRWGDDLIRPLKHMSEDPKMHFFVQNARQRYNDLKALVEGMIQLIENTGSVDSVSDASAADKRLLFKQGFQLMEKFIDKHHPVYKNKNRRLKETIAFTTLKKEYYTSKVCAERQQQVDHFIQYLSEDVDGDHFLKDSGSGNRLDIRRVGDNPKDFFVVFSNFLRNKTTGKRSRRQYVKAINLSLTRNGEVLPFVYKNMINNFLTC